ncbi:MAG TPA: hypothetical protein VK735_21510 [Pseudonocardia sp.]|uniref:hypothetical protein n=1 Tax=Pseudonocardia sp. TaxID=60912 RepID=UPI002B836B24|nr:hypothetical protein [Pseudonocardia sp.]HTF50030.1 hypothetical protein [Pseudonocardia sp.]
MCGACGDRAALDWARPFLAGLPARMAVATAVTRLAGAAAPKVSARAGGWLVSARTGRQTVCTGLTELLAAVRPWLRAPGPFDAGQACGRVVVPPPETRRGVLVRVDPSGLELGAEMLEVDAGAPELGAELAGVDANAGGAEPADVLLVPDAGAARRAVLRLASPPWSSRAFLAGLDGVDQAWAAPPTEVTSDNPDQVADLLVWVEHARQAGCQDEMPLRLRAPLDAASRLDVELRAGHVVRARAMPAPSARRA